MCPTSINKKTEFSVKITQLGVRIYRFDLNGLFSSAAYLTLYQRVKQISIDAKLDQVYVILNFSGFNCISENTNDVIGDKSHTFSNLVYIKYGLSNMSRTIIRSFIPNAKQSKIYEVKDQETALALIRNIKYKQEIDELSSVEKPQLFVKSEFNVLNRIYELYHHKEWVYTSDNQGYSYSIDLIDSNIFVSTVKGNSNNHDSKNVMELFETVLLNTLPRSMDFYMIQDYSQLEGSSNKAQRELIEFLSQYSENINLIVFIGLNRYLRAVVLFEKFFNKKSHKTKVAQSFNSAIEIIIMHKYQINK